jgi:hypothetical protein
MEILKPVGGVMKLVVVALALFFAVPSFASLSRNYVCANIGDVRGAPKPIAYVTVTGQETGGNKTYAALSIPHVRQGGRYTRTLTATIGCPQDKGSKPDYTCTYKTEKMRLYVPLNASGFPEGVMAVTTGRGPAKPPAPLFCRLK